MTGKSEFSRLPSSIIPVNYNLWLKPSLQEFTFDGKVDVEVQICEATSEIVLNSADIKISSATYCQKDLTVFEPKDIVFDEPEERVIIKFDAAITPGSGVLSLVFSGVLNDKMKGFYRSQYVLDGETRYSAVTQFEAADARRCFPCWDEPALKATFDVTLVVPKDRVALSNMNVISEKDYFENSNCKIVKYAKTPIMSTYLLAFVVGEFEFVEGKTANGLPVRVNTPKGKADQGHYALDVAVKALSYYEEYFNIPFPLPKMDLIAISDFNGAMENWGLITYRESVLLIDGDNSSTQTRQLVCLVVCHELAHQWFGNLVTMEWWTHLWLNEGFASFIAYLATDHCHPEFDVWTQFVSTDFKRGIDLDALDNSHPIESPIGRPAEIGEIFDAISYCKGASVLRMLYNWIGDECFRKAMHNYLKKHAYKNTITEDLWSALIEASGKPVEKVMTTWTKQMGFPVISVTVVSRDDNSVTLTLSQRKFQANQKTAKASSKWSIPISFATAESPDAPVKTILLEDESVEVTLENVTSSGWVKVNPANYGFYRVQYDSDLLQALLSAVENKSLPPRDRLGLENDLFALSSCGVSPATDFLKVLCAFKNETNYAVWSDLDSNVGALSVLLWNSKDTLEKFKRFVVQLYDTVLSSLGWNPKTGESHLDGMLRSLLIRRVGLFGCNKTVAEARKRFADHLCDKSCLHANLKFPVYSTILTHGSSEDLDQLIKLHNTVDQHEEKERIERSLGCVTNPEMVQKVLDFAMSDRVRSKDKVFMIGSLAIHSELGRDRSWEFVKNNWDKLHDMYKGAFLMSRLIKMTTQNFSTEEEATKVREFFEQNPVGGERTVQQSIENIRRKCDWWKRDGEGISAWISAKIAK